LSSDIIRRIFVYGSLMEGFFNYEKSFKGKVVSRFPGKVRGSLYHQVEKGYPALIPGEDWVRGELLDLEDFDTLLEAGDVIERYRGPGAPDNEYDRRTTGIETLDGKTIHAWVYWYARQDLGKPENPVVYIPDGDWRRYMETLPR
jgi:gamma-glutamylcyclotransferase (GGCT)/AIG2-like uncharacterized protein YtfP